MLIGPLAKENLPYISGYLRLHPAYRGVQIAIGEKSYSEENVYYADSSFFSTFTFPVINGDSKQALSTRNYLVISDRYAKKYFGVTNPIGQTLTLNGTYEEDVTYTVGAVFDNIPNNSHLQSDIFLSIENILEHDMYSTSNPWKWCNFFTYFITNKKIGIDKLNSDLKQLAIANGEQEFSKDEPKYNTIPLKTIHLNGEQNFSDNNFSAANVYLWIIVAFAIIIMVWVNNVNISIAQSLKSQRSIGVRKIYGANKLSFFVEQFLRFLLLNFSALLFSVLIAIYACSILGQWLGLTFTIPKGYYFQFWLLIIIVLFIGSLILGVINSMSANKSNVLEYLSNKNIEHSNRYLSPQNILLIFQFSISTVIICFAFFSWKQVNDMINVDRGINTERILAIRSAQVADKLTSIDVARSVFENEVLKIAGVKNSSSSVYIPGSYIPSNMETRLLGSNDEHEVPTRMNWIGYNYLDMFQHRILAGRSFSKEFPSDDSAVVINKKLAEEYGFVDVRDAVGKVIFWNSRNSNRTIVGVLEDFHQQSSENAIEPMMFHLWENARGYCLVKMTNDKASYVFNDIEKLWGKVHSKNPFEYVWMDDHYSSQFAKWKQFSRMTTIFSIISTIIACLGLFGIMAFIMSQRIKEIGIRRVNGASISDILVLLNKKYAILVFLSCILTIPFARFITQKWLDGFAYKTDLSLWVFALTGFLLMLITVSIVTLQSLKTVRRNPIESLRYE